MSQIRRNVLGWPSAIVVVDERDLWGVGRYKE